MKLDNFKHALSLPLGGKLVFEKEIKPEEKCKNCARSNKSHAIYSGVCAGYAGDRFINVERSFFPSRFSIGKTFCVQATANGGALCGYNGCGSEFDDHCRYPEQDCCSIHDHYFKPARFKITGGMWHREWVKEKHLEYLSTLYDKIYGNEALKKEIEAEATLSGFPSVQAWLDSFKGKADRMWRVEGERIM